MKASCPLLLICCLAVAVCFNGSPNPDDVLPEMVLPEMSTEAAKEHLSLLDPEVKEIADVVDTWVSEIRRGCTIPDRNVLAYPVTQLTKDGTAYKITFGNPNNPKKVAYSAFVTSLENGFVVKSTSPRPCMIDRVTEDSPELESVITIHQRAIAEIITGKINFERTGCKVSAIDMAKSEILAVSEQTVAGTAYIFRLQLHDKNKLIDVAVVKATMPPGKEAAKDVEMVSVRPDACELFPKTEAPVESEDDEKSLAQEEAERIELINSQQLSWNAGKHEAFDSDLEFDEWTSAYTGVNKDKTPMMTTSLLDDGSEIEANFDWRKKAPKCVSSNRVRNQGSCGSCYAFAKTGMLSHRMCIQSNGTNIKVLSAGYMSSCPYEGLQGCGGGIPRYSGKFLIDKGVPTDQCVPYDGGSSHSYCRHNCKPRRTKSGKVIKDPWVKYHAAEGSHARIVGERQMQLAIKAGGPIEGGMKVFNTFKVYKSGIYYHPEPPKCKNKMDINCCVKERYCHRFFTYKMNPKTKKMVKSVKQVPQKSGGHAYMIVGWGEFAKGSTQAQMDAVLAETTAIPAEQRRTLLQWQNDAAKTNSYSMTGKKFWICENSWGSNWGHKGFFFLERGIDTVEVESGGAYVVQPGHAVAFQANSKCKCNGHGDLATKAVHILSGVEKESAANKCRCDMGWGGKTCSTFCPDGMYKGSNYCTACNDGGDCKRCRSGKKDNEKQVLGDSKCWHTCKSSNQMGQKLGERLRIGGVCGKDKTFPCVNSKTTAKQFAKKPVCVCNNGFTGKRCQYKAACFKLAGSKCATCQDSTACNTLNCNHLAGSFPPKCVSACNGNGKYVMKTYKSQCVCNLGFAGNDCQLDCTKAAKNCQACNVAGVCLVHSKTTVLKCAKADGGATAKAMELPMVLNDFSVAMRFKGSNFKDADLFTWSGTTTTGGSVTSDMGVGQVSAETVPTDFLSIKVSYANPKVPYGKVSIIYNGGDSPVSYAIPITERNSDQIWGAIHPNKEAHISVVLRGMDRKLTFYLNGDLVKEFSIPEYPSERMNNVYTVGRAGFWGIASNVEVANTAFTAAEVGALAKAAANVCDEKCSGCKGKCLFGSCICDSGMGGAKCNEKMVLARFSSAIVDPYHAIMVQSGKWGGRSALPLKVSMSAKAGCTLITADIQKIRLAVTQNPKWKEGKKCYTSISEKDGKYVKNRQCVSDGVILELEDGMMELLIPKEPKLVYNYKKIQEWGTFASHKSVSITPDWRTPLIGKVPLNSVGKTGDWTVAWAQQSATSTGNIKISSKGQWRIQASIDVVVPQGCGTPAPKGSLSTARSPPPEPKSPCYPLPCGAGGICKPDMFDNTKHKCTCKLGWDQSGRSQKGWRPDNDDLLPCDTNGAPTCPKGKHAVLLKCAGLASHIPEGPIPPGLGCGSCVSDNYCVKCVTIVGKSWQYVKGEMVTGVPTQKCSFVDLNLDKTAKAGPIYTKSLADGMVREDEANAGSDSNDLPPSIVAGSPMCK